MKYSFMDMIYLQIFLCFLPIILSGIILPFCIKTLNFKRICFALLLGILSFIPIVISQFFLFRLDIFTRKTISWIFLTCLICNGFIEETFKMLFLNLACKKAPKPTIDKSSFLGIGVLSGLTLASFETLIYFITGSTNIILRICTAVLIHGSCSLMSAIFIWERKRNNSFSFMYFFAILIHGLYNFFASLPGKFWYFSFSVIIFAIIHLTIYLTRDKMLENYDAG